MKHKLLAFIKNHTQQIHWQTSDIKKQFGKIWFKFQIPQFPSVMQSIKKLSLPMFISNGCLKMAQVLIRILSFLSSIQQTSK